MLAEEEDVLCHQYRLIKCKIRARRKKLHAFLLKNGVLRIQVGITRDNGPTQEVRATLQLNKEEIIPIPHRETLTI